MLRPQLCQQPRKRITALSIPMVRTTRNIMGDTGITSSLQRLPKFRMLGMSGIKNLSHQILSDIYISIYLLTEPLSLPSAKFLKPMLIVA